MSSRQLTCIETDLLAKGLNFSITSKTLLNKDIIATVEDAVKDLDNLSKDERKALKEFQSDTSIVILNCKFICRLMNALI